MRYQDTQEIITEPQWQPGEPVDTSNDIVELLMNDYLRVPTIILQMQPVLKNASAYVCLQFIWAKTGGWKNDKDTISYSQFKNDKRYGTGLSTKTIQRSVEKLEELGVIDVKNSFNNMYEFSINLDRIKQLVGVEVRSNCPQAKSNCPSLSDPSLDNLSASQDILSTKPGQFVSKPGQNDLHTNTSTLNLLHKTSTLDKKTEQKKSEPKKTEAKNLSDSKTYKPEKPDEVSDQVWSDLLSHRKIKKTSNTQTAWNVIFSQLEKAKQATGHSLDQIITEWITRDWKGFKSDWYINIQNKTQSTGNNHADNQPANNPANEQPKKSSADIYAENLARDLAQQYPDEFANVPF